MKYGYHFTDFHDTPVPNFICKSDENVENRATFNLCL